MPIDFKLFYHQKYINFATLRHLTEGSDIIGLHTESALVKTCCEQRENYGSSPNGGNWVQCHWDCNAQLNKWEYGLSHYRSAKMFVINYYLLYSIRCSTYQRVADFKVYLYQYKLSHWLYFRFNCDSVHEKCANTNSQNARTCL